MDANNPENTNKQIDQKTTRQMDGRDEMRCDIQTNKQRIILRLVIIEKIMDVAIDFCLPLSGAKYVCKVQILTDPAASS